MIFYGVTNLPNEATPLIIEYLRYKRLSKLGFRFNGDNLADMEADYLSFIDAEFGSVEKEETSRKKTSRKRK